MYKIACVGDYDSIYGFATLGFETFPVTDAAEAEKVLCKLAENEYGVIYITEALAHEVAEEIEKYKERMLPAIILIPGVSDNTGEGVAGVKRSVEKAVGSDILF